MLYRSIWISGADVIKIMDLFAEEGSNYDDVSLPWLAHVGNRGKNIKILFEGCQRPPEWSEFAGKNTIVYEISNLRIRAS